MDDNKMTWEQEPPCGCNPEGTTGPEIEPVPDGAGSSGAFPLDQSNEDMPIGELPSDVPVFGEAVPETNEQGEVPAPAQEPEEGSHSELLAEMERIALNMALSRPCSVKGYHIVILAVKLHAG